MQTYNPMSTAHFRRARQQSDFNRWNYLCTCVSYSCESLLVLHCCYYFWNAIICLFFYFFDFKCAKWCPDGLENFYSRFLKIMQKNSNDGKYSNIFLDMHIEKIVLCWFEIWYQVTSSKHQNYLDKLWSRKKFFL